MRNRLPVILASVFVAAALAAAPAVAANLQPGDMLPENLSVKTMDGKEVTVKSLVQGKPSVIVFFNTSCRNCLNEIKWLLRKFQDKNNVLVSIDLMGAPAVERYKNQYLRDYPEQAVYLDREFDVPMAFGLSVTPSSVLVDKEGKILEVFSGYDDKAKGSISSLYQ